MHTFVYAVMVTAELSYMMFGPAQNLIGSQEQLTLQFFNLMGGLCFELITIIFSVVYMLQMIFIFYLGRMLQKKQSKGHQNHHTNNHNMLSSNFSDNHKPQDRALIGFLVKLSGFFLLINTTFLNRLLITMYGEHLYCDKQFEIAFGCSNQLRLVGSYLSIFGLIFLILTSLYADFFITKMLPDKQIPWAAWNDRSPLMRTLYKLTQMVADLLIGSSYLDIINAVLLLITIYMIFDRYVKPSAYNKFIHILMIVLECQLLVYTFFTTIQSLANVNFTTSGIVFVTLGGFILAILLFYAIDKRELDIKTLSTEIKNFKNLFQIELYVVSMLHELENLVNNEEYAQEKHVHAVISRHMEECQNDACPCKNYEPEYDKKFTTLGSKRLTVNLSMGSIGLGSAQSLQDLKRLPYKITYKTKLEIFKQEFEIRVDQFLEVYPKAYGIKLLKSFFNHKYCDSSYKALFVQLENSSTCKSFKGKIFIYHLKTQIQDEMKKSLESPLSVDINQLHIFEKYKLDFEKYMESLSYNCQQFWTDLTKEDYDVQKTLKIAYEVSEKIIEIKSVFSALVRINPLCIDTSSTYALAYRYILRDEATFSELVTRIQQIKNSSKLEQQREMGVKFFDSDIYSLLMVSGDIKELGRIRQANSSCRSVFGYDPRDLIGSKINKLMPQPIANIHDKFLSNFLAKGKSTFLEKNQALPALTKDGILQMTLIYIKPQVSLTFGLIFSTFSKILNKYQLADDSQEYVKISKLCIFLTDGDGYIHGMNDQCSKLIGMPPPKAKQQLSMNDNQPFNIQQLSKLILQQEYEFELIKGAQMTVDTSFLTRERQFRREYPDIACKIGRYQADVGVHKYTYRDLKLDLNIFVFKIDEKDPIQMGRLGVNFNDSLKSKSVEDELTYSEFSITTANSSVVSSQMATSKFKTFKQKIQSLNDPSQIIRFQRISLLTFFLLISIAAGNFAINFIQNQNFMTNLNVLENLQILIQQVPEASHSSRELLLISNNLVVVTDEIIQKYYSSKYSFYTQQLQQTSTTFGNIQNQIQTQLKSIINFDTYNILVNNLQTDATIKQLNESMQTSLNIFSSKILELATLNQSSLTNQVIPHISFEWQQLSQSQQSQINIQVIQQDVYFILENGLGSIVESLKLIQSNTEQEIQNTSQQAATISIVLASVSIFLVIVLLPTSWPTLTHIEKISQLTLMSLNRLPEVFCTNETKACVELIMFLNEQKEGEKSTHQMIKKHDHRKQNRQILKLPKNAKGKNGSQDGSSYDSDEYDSDNDRSSMIKSQKKSKFTPSDSASTVSRGSVTASVASSKMTQLSQVRANQNQYEAQQLSQIQRVKRNEGGGIELELGHAKTSELLDDDHEVSKAEMSEAEIQQKEKEKARKIQIIKTFRKKKIQKFICLIVTALVIAVYFAITMFYLNLVHQYEQMYANNFELIGNRIQCYTNAVSYVVDTLARNEFIGGSESNDLAYYYVQDCYNQEYNYLNLLLSGMTESSTLYNFDGMNNLFEGTELCQTLASNEELNYLSCTQVVNGILNNGLTQSLFYILIELQNAMINYEDAKINSTLSNQINMIESLLLKVSNEGIISLHEIYTKAAFNLMRTLSLQIIQGFFNKMSQYYNMIFGIFVALLTVFQFIVYVYLARKLSNQIVKMYHVVLLIPFSGRTQNDLNRLMMIKL